VPAGAEPIGGVELAAGPFASLEDLCRRVDLRTVNKRVLESLIKAGAMRDLGTVGALLRPDRLDAALESGARPQRDVAAGQGTLFDLFAMPSAPELPPALDLADNEAGGRTPSGAAVLLDEDGVSRRERLRWEKELLGLYLTEHPLGEIASVLPEFVTAYSGDLAEEADQARVTLGGILQGIRRVVTRAGSTMLVAQLEDLQGTVEVVVFPKVFTDTGPAWVEDAVVLISGRVDHRDDEAKLLCEAVHAWDDAVHMGPVAFSAERDRLARGRSGRGTWGGGTGAATGNGRPFGSSALGVEAPRSALPVGEPVPESQAVGVAVGGPVRLGVEAASTAEPAVPHVSPVKPAASADGGALESRAQSSEAGASDAVITEPTQHAPAEPNEAAGPDPADASDEPSAPTDAVPLQAAPAGVSATIEVVFEEGTPPDKLLPAIEAVTQALRARPGPLAAVLRIPMAGTTRQVRLPEHAAWDERLPEQLRRAAGSALGVELRLAPPTPIES
jgi:hypothetical protein